MRYGFPNHADAHPCQNRFRYSMVYRNPTVPHPKARKIKAIRFAYFR
jgi:hypothetical protein